MKQAAISTTAEQNSKEATIMLACLIRKKISATLCQLMRPIRCSRKSVSLAISLASSKILTHKQKIIALKQQRTKEDWHPKQQTNFKIMILLIQLNQNVERKELMTIDFKKRLNRLQKITKKLNKRLLNLQRKESSSIPRKLFYQCIF